MTVSPLYLLPDSAMAHLVLNRPDTRNALTQDMWTLLPKLLAQAEADVSLRVLIVRGENGHFASGADINEFEAVYATRERAETYSRAVSDGLDALANFPKPTIAQIEGVCIGAGCGIALACDIRMAATGARFGITPGKLGLVYPLNDTKRLMDVVGVPMAKDMLLSARHLDAQEALSCNLINRLFVPQDLTREVRDFATLLASRSSHSARVTKQMVAMIQSGLSRDNDESRALFLDAFGGKDFDEGYRAFLEKRAPDFSKDTDS